MRPIDGDNVRIRPEYMYDIGGVVMVRVEDISRILEEQPTIEPKRNEEYNLMVQELLDYEELTKHFYMTTKERGEFQAYVKERLGI